MSTMGTKEIAPQMKPLDRLPNQAVAALERAHQELMVQEKQLT